MAFVVRQAGLDDTESIGALFRASITAWQRFGADGRVEDVSYEALSVYQRWLHGGAWMSVETAALHLGRLLLGAGVPLVAEAGGVVVGYAEAYDNHETPHGHHLSIAHLLSPVPEVLPRLLDALHAHARGLKCERLTAAVMGEQEAFFTAQGFAPLVTVQRFTLSARAGQVFYRAVDHPDASAAQIAGWLMPAGCTAGARQQWEALWHDTWDVLPEIRARRAFRLRLNAAGQDAFVCAAPQLYNPRALDLYVWSQKGLTTQLLAALRDWAQRAGYRTLVLAVPQETAKALGTDAEPDGYSLTLYQRAL